MLKLRHLFAVLSFTLISGASAAPQAPLVLPEVERIVVEKAARVMTLHGVDGSLHRIEGLQLGDAPGGHK